MPRRSPRSPAGPSSTGRSGRTGSTGWTATWRSCGHRTREARGMAEDHVARNGVRIERTFDVPPSWVWRMWTEPEHFAAWYGPDGATVPVASMDVRVGGSRRVCMEVTTGDGTRRMWFSGEFLEVVESRRLVYTES